VPTSIGRLQPGDLFVSNFNNKANAQGTGTTIDQLTTSGKNALFATIDAHALHGKCPGGVGLTTALNVLPGGYVVVGSLPTSNGMSATAQAGCLIVLDSQGRTIGTIAGRQIQGPWDMPAVTRGSDTTECLRVTAFALQIRLQLGDHRGEALGCVEHARGDRGAGVLVGAVPATARTFRTRSVLGWR
jgi:hypothetical protein